jgi:hypothetical protein
MENEKSKKEIILIPAGNSPEKIENSIAAFSQPLAQLLEHIGLPTENILSSVEERRKVIYALESTIEILPIDERLKSTYLSKFTVAVSVGLFDGALNFLWDETISALRKMVCKFDLQYFLTVAHTVNSKYKNLNSEGDLPAVSDHDLLEISRRIGLVSDINYKRLENVNYFRNHASAAHPNENAVSGMEMLSMLESCLKYAIVAKPDHSVVQIKKLFENIRTQEIPDEDFPVIGGDLLKQPKERIDDFVLSLFGLFTDIRVEQKVKNNIERLIPILWSQTSEDSRYNIGSKFGVFRKNGEVDRKESVQRFLEVVNGLGYKDEDSLTAELIEKLQNLKSVHFEINNFYNEYAHAKAIEASLPTDGIPENIRKLFVKVVCLCYVGNGRGFKDGVDENAVPYYKKFIRLFGVNEVKQFLFLLSDIEFVTDLNLTKPDLRIRELAQYLKSKTKDEHINRALDIFIAYPRKSLQDIRLDHKYKEALTFVK